MRLGSKFSVIWGTEWGLLPKTAIPATVTAQCHASIKATFQINSQSVQLQSNGIRYKINNQDTKFEKYLQTQQQWIQDLCSNWESASQETLVPIFCIDTPLLINKVIAESSKFQIGGYGTILAYGSTILFQNNGKVIVNEMEDISQRRLNLMGILSSLVHVKLLLLPQFYMRNKETHLTVYISSSPIVRILRKQQDEGLKVGEYVNPDIDIVLQIQQEIVALKNKNTFIHFTFIDQLKIKNADNDNEKKDSQS